MMDVRSTPTRRRITILAILAAQALLQNTDVVTLSSCGSMCFRIRQHLVQEAVQSLAEPSGNLKSTLIAGDYEHLSCAVVNRRATAAPPQMALNLVVHLGRGVSIHVFREVGDYRFAANHVVL
jgi:hypothetical protein